jgi:DME family drug/metabolite transporter
MPPLESAFWRGVLAGLAFFIHWLVKREPLPSSLRDWIGIIIFGVFGVALLEGSFVLAVKHGGAALASILLYSAPIWVNLASLIFFKETIPKRRWLALAVTLTGVVGLCTLGGTVAFSPVALTWGLLAGISYAGFYISGKIFFTRLSPVTVYMIAFPVASLVLLPITAASTDQTILQVVTRIFDYSSITLAACLFVGIIATYLPYLLYGAGLRLVDAGRAAIITTVEPVVAVVVASLALGESFTALGYFFSLLVLAGVALS